VAQLFSHKRRECLSRKEGGLGKIKEKKRETAGKF